MKRNNYAGLINSIGLISLLLGVFLTFTAVKTNLDSYNTNKDSFATQYEQSKEMIEKTMGYKNGIGIEELNAEELSYIQTLSDSTLASYSEGLESEYQTGLSDLKAQMWDDIAASAGQQIALILLGIALIFVAKGFSNLASSSTED